MPAYKISPDVTFTIRAQGILASNHRTRIHIWLSLPLFCHLAGEPSEGELAAANLTGFANLDNHFADPTGLAPDPEAAEKKVFPTVEAALAFLADHFVVCISSAAYGEYFARKRSIIDRERLGTFHQQVGCHLLRERRLSPENLWDDNKLNSESGEIRGALYRYVQEPFMRQYFAELDLNGKKVLDFGCGNGMAARFLAEMGAEVIGVDPDRNRLAQARAMLGSAFTPVWLDLTSPEPLAVIPARPVDLVWMSDVFLFYFHPLQPDRPPVAQPAELLARLTRHLQPGGRCTFMGPHGVFWLAPWLGSEEMPYTVLTEYSRKLYSVAPGLAELAEAIGGAGLQISRIYEPKPLAECREVDPRAYHFAKNFPQWWVFELVKPGGGFS